MENERQVLDKDLPELFEYFVGLYGGDRIKRIYGSGKTSITKHYWYPYINTYKKWIRHGGHISEISASKSLLELSLQIKDIMNFENDWNCDQRRDEFLLRLRDTNRVESLLFELRSGQHFRLQALDAHWVGISGQVKGPDIEIRVSSDLNIVVECLFRKPSFQRILSDQKLVDDLLTGLDGKLESSHDWHFPRLVLIKIPEPIDWRSSWIKAELSRKINSWLSRGRLEGINGIFLMGQAELRRFSDPVNSKQGYIPEQPLFFFKNPNARYPLPTNVGEKVFISY
ncbi:MAG: hypothetical protein PHR28_05095 [candidate division Zixibacteria bacterium]|nr:hypothetical protein [candidate division Zixibacteria bacterium]